MTANDPLLEQIATINPYYRAATLLLDRISWDFNPRSWRARKQLKSLHNRYQGQKAVILCNGPSLLKSDLSLLNNVYTLGLNKINLLFEKTPFRPSCIVAANRFVIEQNRDFFSTTEIPLFLDSKALRQGIRPRQSITYFHSANINRFARDCSMSVNQGFTVTYVAMQLAYHMGFQKLALIGCDHAFHNSGPGGRLLEADKSDRNHFDERYFNSGQQWQLPDLPGSEYSYHLAKRIFESSGRSIVNCTEGGELTVFKRQSLQQFVEG